MMESMLIWIAALAMQAFALTSAALAGLAFLTPDHTEAGVYLFAALAFGLLSLLLVVTT